MTVIKNITQDQNGKNLTGPAGAPITWNDVVYIQVHLTTQYQAATSPRDLLICILTEVLFQDDSRRLGYIFANEGDIYTSGSSNYSYTTVIDARRQQVIPLTMHLSHCIQNPRGC